MSKLTDDQKKAVDLYKSGRIHSPLKPFSKEESARWRAGQALVHGENLGHGAEGVLRVNEVHIIKESGGDAYRRAEEIVLQESCDECGSARPRSPRGKLKL